MLTNVLVDINKVTQLKRPDLREATAELPVVLNDPVTEGKDIHQLSSPSKACG
jgi:hypothetical protein